MMFSRSLPLAVSLYVILCCNYVAAISLNSFSGVNDRSGNSGSGSNQKANYVSDRIIEANERAHMLDRLYEGDIKLNVFRNAHGEKWPKSSNGLVRIPYVISQDFSSEHLRVIQSAISSFTDHTCIRFEPRKGEKKYLSIENGLGCFSFVGRSSHNKQVLSLSIPSCISKDVILHELMHVVGFHHEHSRSDRDDYIQIITENIPDTAITQFRKLSTTTNLVPYDYASILHFSARVFAKHFFLNSMEVYPNSHPAPKFGFAHQLSAYDIEEIKYYYFCGSETYARCGNDYFYEDFGNFHSPNYPKYYSAESHCTWKIAVSENSLVKLLLTDIDLESSHFCQLDSIIIHDGGNASAPVLKRICGQKSYLEITSTGNQLFVIFTSDPTREFSGFNATFQSVNSTKAPTVKSLITNLIDGFQCDFDKDMCGMTLDKKADIQFLSGSGSTPTRNTGPSYDHTTGQGKYIFMESSDVASGSNAIIRTPWFNDHNYCITFSYHMYGNWMGGLRIYAEEDILFSPKPITRVLWEKFENQENEWHTESVNFTRTPTPTSGSQSVQFYWKGYVAYYTSDIAIDDIVITKGVCSSQESE